MMNLQNYFNPVLKIAIGLSPALIILSTCSLPTLAQSTPSPKAPTPPDRDKPEKRGAAASRYSFPSTPDRGTPDRTSGGGRRGNSCVLTEDNQPSLTALMPTWKNEGQTVSENPHLYVYVPKTSAKVGEFILIDEKENIVYQTNFITPNQAGIVQISIPASASLKIDKQYKWYFTLICNSEDRSQDKYLAGSLERKSIDPRLNYSLSEADALKRVEIYINNKIWYDTLSNIAPLRNEYPEIWEELLKSVGLYKFVQEPFVDVSQPKP